MTDTSLTSPPQGGRGDGQWNPPIHTTKSFDQYLLKMVKQEEANDDQKEPDWDEYSAAPELDHLEDIKMDEGDTNALTIFKQ